MAARQVEGDGQIRQDDAVATLHGELHGSIDRTHIDRPHLRVVIESVAGDRAGHLRHDFLHRGIVRAKNGCSVERHAVQEIHKRTLEPVEVVTVGFHMVSIDVGHHSHNGQQVKERCIRFIGLDHDVVATAQPCIGTGAIEATANHKRGVQTGFGQHTGNKAGSGGLAMRAGNGDALFQAHQLGQHQGAWNDRNAFLARDHNLRVI